MRFRKTKFALMFFAILGFANANDIKTALDYYVVGDDSRAMYMFEDMCKKSNYFACTRLGLMYEYGFNAKIDLNKAATYYKKACDNGDVGGCEALNNLGKNIFAEEKFGIKKDKDYLSKLSNDKFAEASDAYMLDDGERAFGLFKELCDGGDMTSCARVGLMHEEGIGVRASKVRAKDFYQQACDAKDGSGCGFLAIFYEDGTGGVKQDHKIAEKLYAEACELGYTTGCYNLGVLYDDEDSDIHDYKKAAKYYKISCDQNDSWACGNLGLLYDYGDGVEQDYKKALDLYLRACKEKNSIGCENAGIMYEEGIGVKKDYDKADKLFQKACELGSEDSC